MVSPNTGLTSSSTSPKEDNKVELVVLNQEEDLTKSPVKKKSELNPDNNPEEDCILRAKYAWVAVNKRIKDKKEAAKEVDQMIAQKQAEAQLAAAKWADEKKAQAQAWAEEEEQKKEAHSKESQTDSGTATPLDRSMESLNEVLTSLSTSPGVNNEAGIVKPAWLLLTPQRKRRQRNRWQWP